MDDEVPGEEPAPTASCPPPPIPAARCAAMGVVALLGCGAGAKLAGAIVPFHRIFAEMGIPLPVPARVALAAELPSRAWILGFLALAACVFGARLPRPATLGVLAVSALAAVACAALGGLGFSLAVAEVEQQVGLTVPVVAPPRAAALAADVAAAVRRDIQAARTFVTPAGTTRSYFIYRGPGAPPPPPAEADYAAVHAHPACVLLPDGPDGNTRLPEEPTSYFPRLVEDLSPAALDGGAERATLDASRTMGTTPEGLSALRFSATLATGVDDLSVAVLLTRSRLLRAEGAQAGQDDPFSDRLVRVQVLVFQGFDRAKAASSEIPASNVCVLEVRTEVRR